MNLTSKIYIAGHRGLVGSGIVRALREAGYQNLVMRTHQELDLTRQSEVEEFFENERPAGVIVAAAKVGGILANQSFPSEFLYENLMIASNVIHTAAKQKVEKLLFLGSSCIYPKFAPQPIQEKSLLTGPLEKTNEAYAISKIAGLKLTEYYNTQYGLKFISAMPSNLYGPGDNFHPDHSHVIPGLIRRFHEAKMNHSPVIKVWGTGKPLREFLYVDDLAAAVCFLFQNYEAPELINIGTGDEVTIAELALLIKQTVGYEGKIEFDEGFPDGTPRKVMDCTRIRGLGWGPRVDLHAGLKSTYEWVLRTGALK